MQKKRQFIKPVNKITANVHTTYASTFNSTQLKVYIRHRRNIGSVSVSKPSKTL